MEIDAGRRLSLMVVNLAPRANAWVACVWRIQWGLALRIFPPLRALFLDDISDLQKNLLLMLPPNYGVITVKHTSSRLWSSPEQGADSQVTGVAQQAHVSGTRTAIRQPLQGSAFQVGQLQQSLTHADIWLGTRVDVVPVVQHGPWLLTRCARLPRSIWPGPTCRALCAARSESDLPRPQ